MNLSDWNAFDKAQPEAFYLGISTASQELAATADVELVVGRARLRGHSHVFSLSCGVLRSMFASQAEQPTAHSRGTASKSRLVQLKEAVAGYSVEEVAHFLRLIYHPEDCELKQLNYGMAIVPGMARLAHQLDAPSVLRKAATFMESLVDRMSSGQELLQWVAAAEKCCLYSLQAKCILRLAELLVRNTMSTDEPGSPEVAKKKRKHTAEHGECAAAIADLEHLQGLSQASSRLLQGATLAVSRSMRGSSSMYSSGHDLWRFRLLPELEALLQPQARSPQ